MSPAPAIRWPPKSNEKEKHKPVEAKKKNYERNLADPLNDPASETTI